METKTVARRAEKPGSRRVLNLAALALGLGALVALVYWTVPPGRGSQVVEWSRLEAQLAASRPPSGTLDAAVVERRIRRMEAELRELQGEAAKDPKRPTPARVEQELKRMAAKRHEAQGAEPLLEQRFRWVLGLAYVAALGLVGSASASLAIGGEKRGANQNPADSGLS